MSKRKTTIRNMSKATNQTRANLDTIKTRTKFAIVYLVTLNHSHEYKDRILPQHVSPSLTRDQGEMLATTFEYTQRGEKTRRWKTSFRSLFTGQNTCKTVIYSDLFSVLVIESRRQKRTVVVRLFIGTQNRLVALHSVLFSRFT